MVRMAAAAASTFLLIAALVVPTASASAAESAAGPYDPPTVPELMDRFGLPRALLPATARRYLLHDDGSFQLFLDGGCVAEAGGYRVGYGVKLSGAVAPGRATGLGGVRVRVLFAWVPVTAVEVAGGEVTVSLGPIKKSFPAAGFKSSPRCIAGAATPATASDG
ncbi:uncharacterized protein LOC127771898 [Oryza glaberrima]|nr:uncharacterized protein LOC127771898 [Oryza glaberrima]